MKWPCSHVSPPLTSLSLPQTSQILFAMSNSYRASVVAATRIQKILGIGGVYHQFISVCCKPTGSNATTLMILAATISSGLLLPGNRRPFLVLLPNVLTCTSIRRDLDALKWPEGPSRLGL